MLFKVIIRSLAASVCAAKTIYYDWNVHWMTASVGGISRPVIGINDHFPCPTIEVERGDTIVVDVHNLLENQTTSVHWHGMHQRGTSHMDGAAGVSQCPIPPGSTFTYEFVADQSGLYWYHSHDAGQYPDGLYGMIVVRGGEPFAGRYDEEVFVTVTDFYHQPMYILSQQANSAVQEPIPDGLLINGATQAKFNVEAGKTYLYRFLCASAWVGIGFFFDQHEMTTVEVDGVWIKDHLTGTDQQLRISPGQRMSVLMTAKNDSSTNYGIWFGLTPFMVYFNRGSKPTASSPPLNATSWVVYNETASLPPRPVRQVLNFTDDLDYRPYDEQPILEPVDQQIVLNITQENITIAGHTQQRFALNNITYLDPVVPSLYTALSSLAEASDPAIYGQIQPIYLKYNSVVELVVNNQHGNLHPIHLHGHQFQALARSDIAGGNYEGLNNRSRAGPWLRTPVRRDTLMLQNNGYAVLRFRADNPGIWLFHCHVEWHVSGGLTATMIEAPSALRDIVLPQQHIDACRSGKMPWHESPSGKGRDPTSGQDVYVPQDDLNTTWTPYAIVVHILTLCISILMFIASYLSRVVLGLYGWLSTLTDL